MSDSDIDIMANRVDPLAEENIRLTECLRKANEGFELYERKYYLQLEENEKLRNLLKRIRNTVNSDIEETLTTIDVCIYCHGSGTFDDAMPCPGCNA